MSGIVYQQQLINILIGFASSRVNDKAKICLVRKLSLNQPPFVIDQYLKLFPSFCGYHEKANITTGKYNTYKHNSKEMI